MLASSPPSQLPGQLCGIGHRNARGDTRAGSDGPLESLEFSIKPVEFCGPLESSIKKPSRTHNFDGSEQSTPSVAHSKHTVLFEA